MQHVSSYIKSTPIICNNFTSWLYLCIAAFDVMHYGHMNAFRLGRSLGTYLIVGVNSDESITKCKGPPLMNDNERLTMVEGCKFVDEVVPNCPYIMTSEYLEYIFTTYQVDYVVHGDDPCIVDGKDVYASAKKRGRYRSIPRTEGVSTTDIVGRMLLMTKEHHMRRSRGNSVGSVVSVSGMLDGAEDDDRHRGEDDDSDNEILNDDSDYAGAYGVPLGNQSKFLTTTNLLRLFSAGVKPPEEGMKVIYVDGAWDMFHCGHVEFLKEASKRGDYLIVGIHGDAAVNKRRGGNLPLMNLHERVLSVLGCKYANDVLIDAPVEITPDMIASLKISEVVHGTESDSSCTGKMFPLYELTVTTFNSHIHRNY
jgi:ethanolamine-phosphate cytidylyltransferase